VYSEDEGPVEADDDDFEGRAHGGAEDDVSGGARTETMLEKKMILNIILLMKMTEGS
jgi:hypothetical protein